ncbi:MAG: MBL fold metallo-hydrolase, partial [Sphingorhabdus sp.]
MKMRPVILALFALSAGAAVMAQQDFSKVEVKAEQLAPGVAVLFGAGGNIGVSYGEDGTTLIDDQYAPMTEKIQGAVTALGATPVKFLVNTHWHGDHSGGNENLGSAGAVIMAHDNVRVRLAAGTVSGAGTAGARTIPPAPAIALPVITYAEGLKLH